MIGKSTIISQAKPSQAKPSQAKPSQGWSRLFFTFLFRDLYDSYEKLSLCVNLFTAWRQLFACMRKSADLIILIPE